MELRDQPVLAPAAEEGIDPDPVGESAGIARQEIPPATR
jgi:hypothetical protein